MAFGVETQEVERRTLSILRTWCETHEPVGALEGARHLKSHGDKLSERAVRIHLRPMDERGLTDREGRDGRLVTERGIDEPTGDLLQNKVGPVLSTIETTGFQKDLDWRTCTSSLPANCCPSQSGNSAEHCLRWPPCLKQDRMPGTAQSSRRFRRGTSMSRRIWVSFSAGAVPWG